MMANKKLPILSAAIPAFEKFMMALEALKALCPDLADVIDIGLTKAVKYYKRMDETIAYVVALFLHPAYRLKYIKRKWDTDYVERAEAGIIKLSHHPIDDQMHDYHDSGLVDIPQQPMSVPKPAYVYGEDPNSDSDLSDSETLNNGLQSVEQEYGKYILGSRLSVNTNLLVFWESNHLEFPTLFWIAMDYLAIQASSVPSERVFSSSKETDTNR
ncbi:hypothetical protein DXG01_001143 [Tephrocybe rancida]|nr:hypothetical protein DXG01_001143 [Tephrocybe rancida]